MSLVSRDPILLTPGPLTTSLPTKAAMLRDWGSWDASFNAITARVRGRLLAVANAEGTHVCVPMQGSGTFSVEAAVNTLVPRDGHLLVLINGAYGHRMAKLATMMGRRVTTFVTADDVPTTPADVDRLLASDGSITHVGLIHCETSTGIHNPLEAIAEVVARRRRRLLIDAMSSFGALAIDARRVAFDALVAASGKCIEGPPGMGFVIARREPLERAAGNSTSLALDLHDQWAYMEKTTQWRYTPRRTSSRRSTPPWSSSSPRAASRRDSRATRGTARRSSAAWARSASGRFSTRRSRRRSSSPSTRPRIRATSSKRSMPRCATVVSFSILAN